MFDLVFGLFPIIFLVVFVFIIYTSFRTFSTTGQIFRLAQQRMKQELEANQPKPPRNCDYCGSSIEPDETECHDCGADVAAQQDNRG